MGKEAKYKEMYMQKNVRLDKSKTGSDVCLAKYLRISIVHVSCILARVVPLEANRSKPFFFKIKLPPINMLELIASAKPM